MLYVNFALGKTRTKKNTKKTLNSAAEKKYEDEIHGTQKKNI